MHGPERVRVLAAGELPVIIALAFCQQIRTQLFFVTSWVCYAACNAAAWLCTEGYVADFVCQVFWP